MPDLIPQPNRNSRNALLEALIRLEYEAAACERLKDEPAVQADIELILQSCRIKRARLLEDLAHA